MYWPTLQAWRCLPSYAVLRNCRPDPSSRGRAIRCNLSGIHGRRLPISRSTVSPLRKPQPPFEIRWRPRRGTPIIPSARIVSSRSGFPTEGECLSCRTPRGATFSASSVRVKRRRESGKSMKKARARSVSDLRPEYKRSDFGEFARGKYAARLATATNVVVLKPEVAKAFPNDRAVNEALLSLIKVAEVSTRPSRASTRPARRRRSLAAG